MSESGDTKKLVQIEEGQLRFVFSNVNDWLKYAETKNAALIVANIATAFGAFRVAATSNLHPIAYYYGLVAAGILLLATAISLASFIPQLKIPWISQLRAIKPEDNILYYGHIANHTPESFLKELYTKNGHTFGVINPLEEDYAEQIVINSRIALRKYNLFTIAVFLTISALATPIFAGLVLISRFVKIKKRL